MNDRTIIRPGGRRPRKNRNDESADSSDAPLREDEDDRTQVRTKKSEPPGEDNSRADDESDRTQVRPKETDTTQKNVPEEPEGETDDRTQVRPKKDTTQKSAPQQPEEDSDDRTRVRPVSRSAEDTQSSGGKEIDWSEIDNAFALLDEDDEATRFRDRDVESDADDATQVRQDHTRSAEDTNIPADDATQVRSDETGRSAPGAGADDPTELPEDRSSGTPAGTRTGEIEKSLSAADQFVERSSAAGGDSGVVGLVSPLFVMVGRLQSVTAHPNLEEFREYAIETIRHFESISFGFQGADAPELSRCCSYALCCLVDEIVRSTPWGMNSSWKDEGLLDVFHGESDGSEHFYDMLEDLEADPAKNLAALELFYICLELGFEGRYAAKSGGGREVHDLRNRLYNTIEATRGSRDYILSDAWEGVRAKTSELLFDRVPGWVVLSVTAGLMIAVYVGFNLLLSQTIDPTMRSLAAVTAREPEVFESVVVLPGTGVAGADSEAGQALSEPAVVEDSVDIDELSNSLASEIRNGTVEVLERDDAHVVRLKHRDLFASGSARIGERFNPVVKSIGEFLHDTNSHVVVTGHTDDVPIRSLKYPSNWELSTARAESVRDILVTESGLSRIRAQGLADTDNIVSNSSPANRALNRRVEIQIKK